jgi:hypothetical protein
MTAPAPVSTSSGATLPLVADTLSVEQHLGAITYIGGGAAGFMTQQP